MNNTGRTIAKNATVLMFSQILTWGMAIILMAFLPRYLGAVGMGKLHLAGSLWAIVNIVVSFGMDTFLTREIARSPEKIDALFSASVGSRMLLFVLGVGGMVAYTQLAGYPDDTVAIIFIIGIASLIGQLGSSCRAILNGLERMEFVSISDIAAKGITTVLSIILLLLGYRVVAIALVIILGTLIGSTIQYLALRRVYQIRLQKFDLPSAQWLLKASFPFLIMNGFLVFYAQVDVVIISLLVSEEALGWYGAADRLFSTLLFIPSVFMMAVLPALSRMHTEGSGNIINASRMSFDLLLLVAVPLGFGLFVMSDPLIALIFGPDFAGSGPILMAFGIVLIMTYQNILVGMFLISTDRQNAWTRVIIIATLVSIPLALMLIPWSQRVFNNGALGGTFSYIITEAFMLIAGIRLLPKGTLGRANLFFAARTLLAGIVMVGAIWWLRDAFLLIPLVVGAAVYLAGIIILRLISPENWEFLKYIMIGVLGKLGLSRVQAA